MIPQQELRIGNRVLWSPKFAHSNVAEQVEVEIASLLPDKAGYIRSHLEHRVEPFEDDIFTTQTPYASYEDLQPVPLTDEWNKKFLQKIKYPDSIKFLHELQNWYFWNNEKKELEIND